METERRRQRETDIYGVSRRAAYTPEKPILLSDPVSVSLSVSLSIWLPPCPVWCPHPLRHFVSLFRTKVGLDLQQKEGGVVVISHGGLPPADPAPLGGPQM